MPSPLSYEPSVQAILGSVLPPDTKVIAGEPRLRNRVTWPVAARSTGLGEIEGGELVLVPAARVAELGGQAHRLAASGIAGLVLDTLPAHFDAGAIDLPVLLIPPEADLRGLQSEIERYITRRRRELFALDQELHRTLVDGAIAGSGLAELTALAARRAGRQILIDREGEIVSGTADDPVPEAVLAQARASVRDRDAGPILISGSPGALVAPIVTGREQYGLTLVIGTPAEISDDHEVILVSLASAAAIVLAREPETALHGLESALASIADPHGSEGQNWLALAVADEGLGLRRLRRALQAELEARNARAVVARDGEALVALLDSEVAASGESLARALRSRTGSATLRAGIGRAGRAAAGARRTSEQALAALERAKAGRSVEYAAIEVEALLARDNGWQDFAAAQLGPLLGQRPDERELLHTLRAYLDCGRNARAAARVLQVHRNTLHYRLRRIAQTLGRELDDSETLFALELACRIVDPQANRR